MRKYRYLAMAAGVAMVLSVPAGVAVAANVHKAPAPVLTISKVHGTAVRNGAKLAASLEKGTKVAVSIGSAAGTCKSASFGATVVKNPSAKGKATIKITSETIGGCAPVKVDGFTATVSLKAIHLDYAGTISTAKNDPVVIAESSKSKPIGFDAAVDVSGVGDLSCVFTATSATGHASNKHNTVAFSHETFTLNKALTGAEYSTCSIAGTKASFTATFGPVVDKSVKKSPKVFIS
jgi:hypothetical protein